VLKELVKNAAYELGADLVGFGGIERCKHAPIMMSPQGVFPGAKTVIVMGIHRCPPEDGLPRAMIVRGRA